MSKSETLDNAILYWIRKLLSKSEHQSVRRNIVCYFAIVNGDIDAKYGGPGSQAIDPALDRLEEKGLITRKYKKGGTYISLMQGA